MSQVKVASQKPVAYQSPSQFSGCHPANFFSGHEPFHHLPFAPSCQLFCLSFDPDEHPQSFHCIGSGWNVQDDVSRPLIYCFQPFTKQDFVGNGQELYPTWITIELNGIAYRQKDKTSPYLFECSTTS